jgi:hypothetical protein
MTSERMVLITNFLTSQKDLIKVHGVERKAGVYKHYWAKFCCGSLNPSTVNYDSATIVARNTIDALKKLHRELDELIIQDLAIPD